MSGLTIGTTGYLVGGAGDEFDIFGDFLNSSTQNMLWNTDLATLLFEGGGTHSVSFGSADEGENGFLNNFAWGDVKIDAGDTLDFTGTIYAGLLELTSIDQLFGSGSIYYDMSLAGNAYLRGLDYTLAGGGHLFGVNPNANPPPGTAPEPGTLLLMFLGLGGLAAWRRRGARTRAAA
jgi:hypothetical protein